MRDTSLARYAHPMYFSWTDKGRCQFTVIEQRLDSDEAAKAAAVELVESHLRQVVAHQVGGPAPRVEAF